MGLLEEIKEEILKEEEIAEVEMKKGSYKRLGTWSNITITSSFVQNSEEAPPLSPAEDKDLDQDETLRRRTMSDWKAPKAIARGGTEVVVKELAMTDNPLVDIKTGKVVREA